MKKIKLIFLSLFIIVMFLNFAVISKGKGKPECPGWTVDEFDVWKDAYTPKGWKHFMYGNPKLYSKVVEGGKTYIHINDNLTGDPGDTNIERVIDLGFIFTIEVRARFINGSAYLKAINYWPDNKFRINISISENYAVVPGFRYEKKKFNPKEWHIYRIATKYRKDTGEYLFDFWVDGRTAKKNLKPSGRGDNPQLPPNYFFDRFSVGRTDMASIQESEIDYVAWCKGYCKPHPIEKK
jgi:hypothetical protein